MKRIERQQCIADLRSAMLKLADDKHSICEVATTHGIFCKGFSQWSFEELKKRYDWITASRPNITRPQLEKLANLWQLARQEVYGTRLACDTQSCEHDTCLGFDGWKDADLARFHEELCGETVEVFSPPEKSPV